MTTALRTVGDRFVDASGRSVLLRGINLGGDCKLPYPDGATCRPTDFADHRGVSFVGRPFPLAEAATHLGRLRRWGFNCLRLLTSWEAIAHAGPGQFDAAYLDYFAELCARAGEHGLYVVVDFHQDVFSRMTGGDGAPGWALEALGLDVTRLGAADAALVMQQRFDPRDPRPVQPERYPPMGWTHNYQYPANGILWTLFFGGDRLLPEHRIDGSDVASWLQGQLVASQVALAQRLVKLPHVIGFDLLNEPSRGWIGFGMHDRPSAGGGGQPARPGLAWSPLEALAASHGQAIDVPDYQVRWLRLGCVPVGHVRANPQRISIWRRDDDDPFLRAGAFELAVDGSAHTDRPDFFQRAAGRTIDFERDCWRPFVERSGAALRALRPDWLLFVEREVHDGLVEPGYRVPLPAGAVNASHWYDALTLLLKRFAPVSFDVVRNRPVLGSAAIGRMYRAQLERLRCAGQQAGVPSFVGEFGLPFDLDDGRAYRRWAGGDRGEGPWRAQVRALDLMYGALDGLGLSSALWNYTASNRNDPRHGDGWNQEDLSIFSVDQQTDPADPDSGGRALSGLVRPYARSVQGRLTSLRFDRALGRFELEYLADPAIDAATEIFVPALQYPTGCAIDAADHDIAFDASAQLASLRARRAGPSRVVIRRRG